MEPYYTIEVKEKNKNGNIIDGVVIIKGGKGYRLPTEAEWEYAAKGGSKSKGFRFSGSDNADEVSWYNLNSDSKTHAVGEKLPNELGIYDMSGNVWEWCWDWYGKNYYSKSPVENPTGPETGNKHIERGGCWSDNNTDSRSSYRGNGEPFNIFTAIGFRVVKGI